MDLIRLIGGSVSKQAFRMNISTSVRHDQELDVDTTAFSFGVDFTDQEAFHLSRLLAGNISLKTIRLRIRPNLSVRGADVLAKSLVRTSIKKVHLFGTVRSMMPGQDAAAAVILGNQHHTRREHFGPNRFNEGHPVWEFPNPDVVQTLLVGISRSRYLQELVISYYSSYPPGSLTSENVQAIALFLRHSKCIQRLRLDFNSIHDADVAILVQSWPQDSPLQEVHLKLNRIGAAGAMDLMRVATTHRAMQFLDLSFNFDIGYDGIQQMAEELLPRVYLKELKLCGCIHHWDTNISTSSSSSSSVFIALNNDVQAMVVAREKAGRALVEGMKRNIHLQICDVRKNFFPQHVLAEITFYCELNKRGRYLIALEEENRGLAPAIWCRVLAKCRDEFSFMYYFLREQPNLVRHVISRTNARASSFRTTSSRSASTLSVASNNTIDGIPGAPSSRSSTRKARSNMFRRPSRREPGIDKRRVIGKSPV
jgi:hypothetical protein